MEEGKLIVFSAPSGSGKTTIVRHLLRQPELNLDFSISATSRKPRPGEKEGEDYYFMSADEFKQHIAHGDFLEWEEVYSDHFYGTLKKELQRIWAKGKHVIFDIDVVGGLNIKQIYPEKTLAVFVKSPSIEELEQRLKKRQSDSEKEIETRLQKAEKEMKSAAEFDEILLNDNLGAALQKAGKLVGNFIKSS